LSSISSGGLLGVAVEHDVHARRLAGLRRVRLDLGHQLAHQVVGRHHRARLLHHDQHVLVRLVEHAVEEAAAALLETGEVVHEMVADVAHDARFGARAELEELHAVLERLGEFLLLRLQRLGDLVLRLAQLRVGVAHRAIEVGHQLVEKTAASGQAGSRGGSPCG
jgi:Zn-dependent peptidase ImmA (M78 family)